MADEASLVERAKARDSDAWAELYAAHQASLYRHARYLCGDPTLAEEIVQDVFVQAALSIDRFAGNSTIKTWLHGIALNLVRAQRRKRRNRDVAYARLREVENLVADSGPEPDKALLQQRRAAALFAALERLPDNLREAFILRDLQGMSPGDAAQQLGITAGNLSVRATRARAKLNEILSQIAAAEGVAVG